MMTTTHAGASSRSPLADLARQTQARTVGHHQLRLRRQLLTACSKNDAQTVVGIINQVSSSAHLLAQLLLHADPAVGTPLHVAARRGHLDTIKVLVQYVADVDATYRVAASASERSVDASALLCALQHGHMDVAKFLLELGASAEAGGVAEWLARHPRERRLVDGLAEDSVKTHAIETFNRTLQAKRDLEVGGWSVGRSVGWLVGSFGRGVRM